MTDRQERKAAQNAKIAAMPLGKKMAIVFAGGLSAIAAGVLVNLLLSGEPKLGFAITLGVVLMAVMGFQYLRPSPAQDDETGEPK